MFPDQAGDFGSIDRKTGTFDREGNIYDDPQTSEIAQLHPAEAMAEEDSMVLQSYRAKAAKQDAGVDV